MAIGNEKEKWGNGICNLENFSIFKLVFLKNKFQSTELYRYPNFFTRAEGTFLAQDLN